MKGLILKDFYMAKAYCRSYLFIFAVFLAVSLAGSGNLYILFYPCIFCSMISVVLLAYDEQSRFLQYGSALPYSKKEYVTAKYVFGIIVQLFMLVVSVLAYGIKLAAAGDFNGGKYVGVIMMVCSLSSITVSVSLPFMFRFGVEKGRIAYYVIIGVICALGVMLANALTVQTGGIPDLGSLPIMIIPVGMLVYFLSWRISVIEFGKRQL